MTMSVILKNHAFERSTAPRPPPPPPAPSSKQQKANKAFFCDHFLTCITFGRAYYIVAVSVEKRYMYSLIAPCAVNKHIGLFT